MIHDNSVEFELAEVVGRYSSTYKSIPGNPADKIDNSTVNDLFTISVRTYTEDESRALNARPANPNIKQIPLIGEHVLIFRAINQENTADNRYDHWYYFPAFPIQSGINNNALPGISRNRGNDVNDIPQSIAEQPLGEEFEEKIVSPLQPFEGDVLLEGRWGNSIRLGSTGKQTDDRYSLNSQFTGESSTDPIIILSNQQINKKNKEFVVESFEDDHSSLYLTSTQQINDSGIALDLKKHTAVADFNSSQFIGSANRVILHSKEDSIILNSSRRISLIASEGIRIGSDNANIALVRGDKLKDLLAELINLILGGVQYTAVGIVSTPVNKDGLTKLRENLNTILSSNHYIDK
jgi:hypothetical protein